MLLQQSPLCGMEHWSPTDSAGFFLKVLPTSQNPHANLPEFTQMYLLYPRAFMSRDTEVTHYMCPTCSDMGECGAQMGEWFEKEKDLCTSAIMPDLLSVFEGTGALCKWIPSCGESVWNETLQCSHINCVSWGLESFNRLPQDSIFQGWSSWRSTLSRVCLILTYTTWATCDDWFFPNII